MKFNRKRVLIIIAVSLLFFTFVLMSTVINKSDNNSKGDIMGLFDIFKKKSASKVRYVCVLHFRLRSAMITPSSYPVKKYAVAYNGKCSNHFIKCNDDGRKIKIKVDCETITLELHKRIETISYSMNKECSYRVPLCGAMESWSFIVSDSPIQYELFTPGYQLYSDGVYYNIEDMRKDMNKKTYFAPFPKIQ